MICHVPATRIPRVRADAELVSAHGPTPSTAERPARPGMAQDQKLPARLVRDRRQRFLSFSISDRGGVGLSGALFLKLSYRAVLAVEEVSTTGTNSMALELVLRRMRTVLQPS